MVFFSMAVVSGVLSWILVRIFNEITSGMSSGLVGLGRTILFTVTWSAVTTMAGMHSFKKLVRQLRRSAGSAGLLG